MVVEENTMEEEKTFTAESIAAASAALIDFCRSVAKEDPESIPMEQCGRCGCDTGWDEAMYDLLARSWVCPKCWKDGVG